MSILEKWGYILWFYSAKDESPGEVKRFFMANFGREDEIIADIKDILAEFYQKVGNGKSI